MNNDNYKMIIGKNIKKGRIERNMTQAALAEKVGLSADFIGRVERGEKGIEMNNLIKIANELEVSLSELTNENAYYDFIAGEDKKVIGSENRIFGNMAENKAYAFLKMMKTIKEAVIEYEREVENDSYVGDGEKNHYHIEDGRLKELYKMANLSSEKLAKKLEKTPSHIYNIQSNNAMGATKTYMEMCNELSIPMDILFAENLKNKTVACIELEKGLYKDLTYREEKIIRDSVNFFAAILKNQNLL